MGCSDHGAGRRVFRQLGKTVVAEHARRAVFLLLLGRPDDLDGEVCFGRRAVGVGGGVGHGELPGLGGGAG